MKKLTFLIAMLVALASISVTSFGQKRPVRKTTAPISKPKVTETPAEVEVAPVKEKVVEVSPAQGFFNQGLKCEAKDYDCQISNYTKAVNLNLNTKEVFKNRGNAYLQRKDFDKAIADFTKLIELDLNDASGYKNRGRIFLENSNSPQAVNAAIRDFTSAIDLEPKDVEAYSLRSKAYLKINNNEKASADLTKISALEPNNMSVVLNSGELFLKNKEYDKAIEFLTKAITVKPSVKLYLDRANAYAAQKKYDLAVADYNKAIGFEPGNAEIYFKLGQMTTIVKKYDEAIADYTKAIGLNPKYAQAYTARGWIYYTQKNYDKSFEDASKAVEADPTEYGGYNLRAYSHFLKNGYKQDEQYNADIAKAKTLQMQNAVKKIENNPQDSQAYLERGHAYYANQQYDLAVADYAKALELEPKNSNAYLWRGYTFAAKTQYDLAIGEFTKAIEIEPKNADLYSVRATYLSVQKQYDQAIDDLSKAIEIEPQNANLYLSRSSQYAVQNKHDLAIIDMTKAIEVEPRNVNVYASRANYYTTQKQFALAINDYTKAIEIDPANKSHYILRGYIYWGNIYEVGDLKNSSKAIEDFKKVIELDPKDRNAYDYVARLIFPMELRDKGNNESKYLEALVILSKAIEADPSSAVAYYNRGNFLSYNSLYRYMKGKIEFNNKFGMSWQVPSLQMARYDFSKCVELNDKTQSDLCNRLISQVDENLDRAEQQLNLAKRRKDQRNQELLGILGVVVDTAIKLSLPKGNQVPITTTNPQPNTPSRPQTTQSGELSNGGTVSAQQNWGAWSTSSCNSDIQFSVINDGPVPGDNTRTYWRIRARSRNGRHASLDLFYGESQADIDYAIANRNANAKGESRRVVGNAYLESDRIKTNFPQVDIRNNSNIFVRIVNIGWQDSSGAIVENVRCGGR